MGDSTRESTSDALWDVLCHISAASKECLYCDPPQEFFEDFREELSHLLNLAIQEWVRHPDADRPRYEDPVSIDGETDRSYAALVIKIAKKVRHFPPDGSFRDRLSATVIPIEELKEKLQREDLFPVNRLEDKPAVEEDNTLHPEPAWTPYRSPEEWRKWLKFNHKGASESSWKRFKREHNGENHPSSGYRSVRFRVDELKTVDLTYP